MTGIVHLHTSHRLPWTVCEGFFGFRHAFDTSPALDDAAFPSEQADDRVVAIEFRGMVATWWRRRESNAVHGARGHDAMNRARGHSFLRSAKLAVVTLLFSLLAVPVTCADAHGAHSLFAPPDGQSQAVAAALLTLHFEDRKS